MTRTYAALIVAMLLLPAAVAGEGDGPKDELQRIIDQAGDAIYRAVHDRDPAHLTGLAEALLKDDYGIVCIFGLQPVALTSIPIPSVSNIRNLDVNLPAGPSFVMGDSSGAPDDPGNQTVMVRSIRLAVATSSCSAADGQGLGYAYVASNGAGIDPAGWSEWLLRG